MFYLNKIGLYLLYLLLIIIPFHFAAGDFGVPMFYREIIGISFLLLLLVNLYQERYLDFKIRKELLFLILGPVLLIFSALYDPMIILYSDGTSFNDITSESIDIDPRLYVLRNAILYLPMILYFSRRGMSKKEIEHIAIISVAVAPLSILFYVFTILESGYFSIFLLGEMSEKAGIGIEYNSYVPYLSFPVISGMFILSGKHSSIIKLLTLVSISISSMFIFLSSSRQTFLLIAIALVLFMFLDKSNKNLKKIALFSFIGLCVFSFYSFVMSGYELNTQLVDKYTGGRNYRFIAMANGLDLLSPYHYITGAGLTSVIVSGPHNDYIRWTQRVGLFYMIILFYPYFSAAFKCFISTLRERSDLTIFYIGISIFFIIYHSVFGYPREDVYQSVWAYLGITMWLGYTNKKKTLVFDKQKVI